MDAVEEEEVGSASRLTTRAAMKKIMSLPRIACWTDLQMDHQEHTEGQNSRVGLCLRIPLEDQVGLELTEIHLPLPPKCWN